MQSNLLLSAATLRRIRTYLLSAAYTALFHAMCSLNRIPEDGTPLVKQGAWSHLESFTTSGCSHVWVQAGLVGSMSCLRFVKA